MARAYDLIVIGSGTAAQVASHRMASAGWKVAVIDHRPFGGTCALRGCDPKKMLLAGAQVIDDVSRMSGRGVVAKDARISWRDLMAYKRSFTRPIPAKHEQRYREKGIDTFHATARFAGPNTIEINGEAPLQAKHLLIAAGAQTGTACVFRPRTPQCGIATAPNPAVMISLRGLNKRAH